MDKFLQVVGWFGIGIVALVLLAVMAKAGRGDYAMLALLGAMTWALPAIIGFVIIASFGNMLCQLKAIRAASERQADMFSRSSLGGELPSNELPPFAPIERSSVSPSRRYF